MIDRQLAFIPFRVQKTNQQRSGEKGSRPLAASLLVCGFPVLLEITGRCETRGVYAPQGCSNSRSLRHDMAPLTSRTYPVISPLLSCVKWPFKTIMLSLQYNFP